MVTQKDLVPRLKFLKNGEALVGLVFLLAGIFVAIEAVSKLKALWFLFSPYFPVSFQDHAGQRLLNFLPFIIGVFINLIGSICAVLIGIVWALSGLGEVFESWKQSPPSGDFKHPELVAEALRTGQGQHWQSSAIIRMFAALWPRARLISPISHELLSLLLRSCVKTVFAGILIAVVFYIVQSAPGLLNRYLQFKVNFLVPSPKPLFLLLGFMILLYILIGFSLLPLQRAEFVRSSENVMVRGKGDPHLFFALLEEGLKLLTARPLQHKMPVRLEQETNPRIRGTLVENSPEPVTSWASPAGYICLPIFFLLLTMGFTRLIHFRFITDPIPYNVFLRADFLNYVLEVVFALSLMIVGLQLADVTRRLFGVRKFRSTVVFCHVGAKLPYEPASDQKSAALRRSTRETEIKWKIVEGVDDQFARWVREPEGTMTFRVNSYWAEVFSESVSAEGARFLVGMHKAPSMEAAMERILKIPLSVNFQFESPVAETKDIKASSEPPPRI
ncbi:MAG TPA: hypothetical protein VMC85_09440 [Desulfomonilaceae bacterium]|nr:hypothetical protein [Desulfomonilaceae bacterium]